MKQKELITALSDKLGWTAQEVTKMLDTLGKVVGTKLVEGDSIHFDKFGQFDVKKKGERISVNPSNGKRYLVPPKLVPVFKPGATMKSKLKEIMNDE